MGDVRQFAEKARSSQSWTPEQCLEAVLEMIRADKIEPFSLTVAWAEKEEGELTSYQTRSASANMSDLCALLQIALADAVDEMRGDE